MIRRVGVRAHDFGKNTVVEISAFIAGHGFTTTQMAPKKAVKDLDDINDALNEKFARNVKKALEKNWIDISVLGCYLNYGQKDAASRRSNVEVFLKHIDLCEDFGARMVGTETGSLNTDYSFHSDNHGEEAYKLFLSSVEKMAERAEEKNVMVAIEAVSKHIINTPQRMKRIIDDIASPNLAVIFDPVNLMTPENYKEQDSILRTSFDLLGDKIIAVHAKDFITENDKIAVKAVGKGLLNYNLYMDLVMQSERDIDVLLENIKPNDMAESKEFIEDITGTR